MGTTVEETEWRTGACWDVQGLQIQDEEARYCCWSGDHERTAAQGIHVGQLL